MEPCTRSVYDVLKHNLELAGRKNYIHRCIYIGEHKGEKETEEAFTKVVTATNEKYCEEKITGLLLLYPNYFIHIMDGDEIVFTGHLLRLFNEHNDLFGEMKLIAFYHHINQRFFDEWGIRKAIPPILLEKIDPASDFEELKRYLRICITKVYNLAIELRNIDLEQERPITIGEIGTYMHQFLPEYVLLNYLLNQEMLDSVRFILVYKRDLLDTSYIMQNVWPVRSDYVPFDVFEEELNPVPYLFLKNK